eukprot:7118852-Alexandrium_andersonii.AAC.1
MRHTGDGRDPPSPHSMSQDARLHARSKDFMTRARQRDARERSWRAAGTDTPRAPSQKPHAPKRGARASGGGEEQGASPT